MLQLISKLAGVFKMGRWLLSGKRKYLLAIVLFLFGGTIASKTTEAGANWWDTALMQGLELMGDSKQEILIDRVTAAQATQEEAAEAFTDALEEFKGLTGFDGGELDLAYERLKAAYERSKSAADDVRSRNRKVERAANRLLDEWRSELDDYSDQARKRASADSLRATEKRCDELLAALRAAERRIEPVEQNLKEQVLFLKHSLNSQAIASLDEELVRVETDVELLLADMQASVREAKELIDSLGATQTVPPDEAPEEPE